MAADDQTPPDPKTLERRRFLRLLGAAGVYTPPALAVLASGVTPAFAQGRSQEALAKALARVQGKGKGKAADQLSSLLYSGEDSGEDSGSYPGEDSGSGSYSGIDSGSYPGEDSGSGSHSGVDSGSYPGEDSGSGSYSGEDSGSGSGSHAVGGTIYASGDTFLRFASKNTNEGANPFIRVGVEPVTRGVVKFDRDALMARYRDGARVHLVLHIANNHNNWGQDDDRVVEAYPLFADFVEGNGRQSGMPGWAAARGAGAGATWMSPNDPDVADDLPRGARPKWQGGGDAVGPATAAGAVHANHVEGVDVSWDVTEDVIAGASAWLLKVDERGRPHHGAGHGKGRRGDAGADAGTGGTVEYWSIQGNFGLGPRLVISL
ncbi:MAG: hypothetical protein ACLGHP_01670 [Vicinamibacteria bacterium]